MSINVSSTNRYQQLLNIWKDLVLTDNLSRDGKYMHVVCMYDELIVARSLSKNASQVTSIQSPYGSRLP